MNKIEIIGLGAGGYDQLPLGVYKKLTLTNQMIYTRTINHPVVRQLQAEGVEFQAFDSIYEKESSFEAVYHQIVDSLIEQAKEKDILYTVPGHPMLAEKTVQLLLENEEVDAQVMGGQSYLDDMFTALRIDPIEGFQFVDGTSFTRKQLQLENHLIFCQVYDRMIASDVKLALLEDLPADYEVTVVRAAGTNEETVRRMPLEELDRFSGVDNLTSVYVPPVPSDLLHHTFENLREVIRRLRAPGGCPWDRAQTHESLREHAVEEVYELIEAIDQEDDEGMIEELGDVLLQVMLHSQIGEDEGYFTVEDVIRAITEKMIHRHPHVFGDQAVESVEEVHRNWEQLKKEERGHRDRKSVLDGIPEQLPALAKAYKLQKKAAKVGFDWNHIEDIQSKLEEELAEVAEAIQADDQEEVEKEFGDVLFVLANMARFYKINPELALNRTNQKFFTRFTYMEDQLTKQGKQLKQTELSEMDYYWEEAKGRE
jgi:tetrapyrrole methylase family protein/MazG family protein